MNFEIALENMRKGRSVRRECWKDGMHLKLMTNDSYEFHKVELYGAGDNNKISCEISGLFFILVYGEEVMHGGEKHYPDRFPDRLKWRPLQCDLLALDWTHA